MSPRHASDPGARDIRMRVLEPVSTPDGMAGKTTIFTYRRSVWAQFSPDAPTAHTHSPITDARAAGTVRMAIGLAPPTGWRLDWTVLGGQRTLEVQAVQRGTSADPFDLCSVREVTR